MLCYYYCFLIYVHYHTARLVRDECSMILVANGTLGHYFLACGYTIDSCLLLPNHTQDIDRQ
jgi:hypothetical protein